MAKVLANLARMTTATTGTGTITLGSAATSGGVLFLTFAQAGVANGDVVAYAIADTNASEIGYGTYTSSGTTLTRTVIKSTNSNTAINLSGNAQVFITPAAEDLVTPAASSTDNALVRFDLTTGRVIQNSVGILDDSGNLSGLNSLAMPTVPFSGFDAAINLGITASVGSNILTVNVTGANGSAPSATNPVYIPFRDATIATGTPTWVPVTSSLSITTNATGATLGTANSVPFKIWLVAFNNAGTAVLALWQSVTGGATPTSIAALDESSVFSSTAISGSATSAGTFYTPNGTTVTSKAFRILGYLEYGSGLATAGSYASVPTKIQLFGPGINKPGNIVQTKSITTNSVTTVTTSTWTSTALTVSISPTSAANVIRSQWSAALDAVRASDLAQAQIYRNSTAIGSLAALYIAASTNESVTSVGQCSFDSPGTTSSTTYVVKISNQLGSNNVSLPPHSGYTATMIVDEVMT